VTTEYTITPLVLAMGLQREKSRFTYLHGYGERIDIPYVAWLIRGGGLTVLVDSGCSAEQYQRWIKPSQGALRIGGETFIDVVDVSPLDIALGRYNLAEDNVDIFVQTHLDWDHCMGTHRFKSSRVVIQKTELDDLPVHPLFAYAHAPDAVYDEIKQLELDVIDGDAKLADGLDILYTPGHTAGGQSVKVNTRRGTYVIAGLCTVFDNFYVSPELAARIGYDVIPPGTHLDVRVAYESCKRILAEGGPNVLPLHEPSIVKWSSIP